MPDYKKIFDAVKRNAIDIQYTKPETRIAVGQSKFGGKPHLPDGFDWYYYKGEDFDGVVKSRPLSFLTQINLSETAGLDSDGLLPHTGMLYFFYETESLKWGYDPKDKGCARVFYYDGDITSLKERDFPEDLDDERIYPEFALTFGNSVSLPSCEEYSPKEWRSWESYGDALRDYGCPEVDPSKRNKLLGYADPMQSDMLTECARVTNGVYCGGGETGLSAKELDKIDESRTDWTLLMQMGTVGNFREGFELMWGDCGCIYFYIKKRDLAERNFDNVWLVLQCG